MPQCSVPRKPKTPTFKDLVQQPTWSEGVKSRTGANAVRPGGFNAAGEFFDPSGEVLHLADEDVAPDVAQRLVDAGALVVMEECGCGGMPPGCRPRWLDASDLRRIRGGSEPVFTGAYRAPSWIDVWASASTKVVYAHGSVSWRALTL
jgi:hypothetical protein